MINAEHHVQELTIFLDRALVTRRLVADLQPGENLVLVNGLGLGILEESIKVKMADQGVELTGTGLRVRTRWEYRAAAHRQVWDQARTTLAHLLEILDARVVYNLEDRLLVELRDYLQSSLNPVLLQQAGSVPKVREALEFITTRLAANTQKVLATQQDYDQTDRLLQTLKAELGQIAQLDKKLEVGIELTLTATRSVRLEAVLSYLIPGASWQPVYDADLEPDLGRVNLRYYGLVRQSTGEVWNQARVFLSTAAVELSPEIPAIYPLRTAVVEQKRTRTIVATAQAIQELGAVGAVPEAEPDAESEAEGAAEEPRRNLLSVVFPVPDPTDLPSDGQGHRLLLLSQEFAAQVGYEAVPAQMEAVFLKASYTNTTSLPFLEGRQQIYRRGSYIGQAPMAYIPVGQTVVTSFGTDDDLRIRRQVTTDHYQEAEGLLGKNAYIQGLRFLLSNYKATTQTVTVKEALFVSELKEVSLVVGETTSPGYVLDADGILSWQVSLEPSPYQSISRTLDYRVEAGRSFDLKAIL